MNACAHCTGFRTRPFLFESSPLAICSRIALTAETCFSLLAMHSVGDELGRDMVDFALQWFHARQRPRKHNSGKPTRPTQAIRVRERAIRADAWEQHCVGSAFLRRMANTMSFLPMGIPFGLIRAKADRLWDPQVALFTSRRACMCLSRLPVDRCDRGDGGS